MPKKKSNQYTFLDLVLDVLNESDRPLTINEIWDIASRKDLVKKVGSSGKTPIKTLAARIYIDIRDNDNTKIKKVTKRPATFYIKNKVIKEISNEDEDKGNVEDNNYHERDLHILLSSFVNVDSEFACLTKTIYHEKSPRNKKGCNEWVHPDIVGVHFPYDDYSPEIVNLQTQLGYRKHKIYSFEMKKKIDFSNLRECYFQAVSNSSWANEGYLVALDVSNNEEFMSELRRLNNAFGIGIIRLNAENISQSEVLFPSKISENLDWDTIDKLSDNPDFKQFLKEITSTTHSNKQHKVYDEVMSTDEECREYSVKKHII